MVVDDDGNNYVVVELEGGHTYIGLIKFAQGPSGFNMVNSVQPIHFQLYQNYTIPFNPITNIEFRIPGSEYVTLTIYDIKGQKVKRPIGQRMDAGVHHYQLDGTGLASGVYYYQLIAGEYRDVKKMILLR